jgi:hypothetical protein
MGFTVRNADSPSNAHEEVSLDAGSIAWHSGDLKQI